MGANARRLAEREFDRDAMAKRLGATLEAAADRGARSRTTAPTNGFYRRRGKRLLDLAVAVPATAAAAPLLAGLAVGGVRHERQSGAVRPGPCRSRRQPVRHLQVPFDDPRRLEVRRGLDPWPTRTRASRGVAAGCAP